MLAGRGDVDVVVSPFERWEAGGRTFDLVFAATSWHWLDPRAAYRRAAELLRPAGCLAIVATEHVLPPDGADFFRQVRRVYEEVGMSDGRGGRSPRRRSTPPTSRRCAPAGSSHNRSCTATSGARSTPARSTWRCCRPTPDTSPPHPVATDLLAELLIGIDTPHAFVPPDRHTGLCRICGATATLTFEHIPPCSAGNDRRARSSPSLPLLTSEKPLDFPKTGWTPAQRGVGGYVLCKPCNEFVGHRYIPEYSQLATALCAQVNSALAALGHAVGGLDLDLAGWALGDVARAGLVTVMDVAVHDRLLRRYPELTNVVRQPGTALPSTLRLGLTLVLGTRARHPVRSARLIRTGAWCVP